MTTTGDTCVQRPASARCTSRPPAAELAALVQAVLGVIARCRDALLQEQAETQHVIRNALAQLCQATSFPRTAEADWPEVQHELDRLLARALSEPERSCSQQDLCCAPLPAAKSVSAAPSGARLAHLDGLARWFAQLATTLNDTHPRAVEMLGLRLTGLGSREIAERLGLPFRLVDRVLGVLRVQLAEPKVREELLP